MATRDELAAQIRFQLDQLSARNGHHDFEHLCRHLARMRICSNILPATGPVSAGGDQGRDFETFRTYLSESPIAGSSFVGLASQEPLVFACTLTQKDNLKAKVKADVAVIKGSGAQVAGIHYFCSADLPTGQRHDLQKWSSEDHGVQLEIYDGQAISELLIEPDVFWIASRYLSIPAEIYPASPGGESWYLALLTKWKRSDLEPQNFADFGDLKSAARHATSTESEKPDLPFWIEKLTALQSTTTWAPLRRRSIYEIAVASLRGLGTLEGYEEQLRAFFSDVSELYETADLEDAAVLWTYCAGAHRRGLVRLESNELTSWQDALVAKVDTELTRAELPGRRSSLLDIRGFLAWLSMSGQPDAKPDFDGAMKYWRELTDILDKAPLYPLDRFADRLTKFLEMGAPPDLEKLTSQVDELLASRRGQAAAAEKCRDRALVLYRKGEITRAIKQIHQAKVKWFSEETLRGSILTMLFLAKCYQDLDLLFAAKFYALMAAYTSLRSSREDLRKLAPSALSAAASCDYAQGAWCGFLDLELIALGTFSAFSREDDPSDPDSEINKALFHVWVIHRMAQIFKPDMIPLVEDRVSRWGLTEEFEEFLLSLDNPWQNQEVPEIWISLEKQLLGRPFSDLGAEREVAFAALGVTWRAQWENTYEMTAAAEQFLAILQIMIADLADLDMCLLRTTVNINIQLGEGEEIRAREIFSNDSTEWEIKLPVIVRSDGINLELTSDALATATTLLHSASLLPHQRLLEVLEDAFREGLTTKVFSVERYEVLYRQFISEPMFDDYQQRSKPIPEADRSFTTGHQEKLKWFGGPGPRYSKERAAQGLNRRYQGLVPPIHRTLGRLSQSREFQEVVRALRTEGWLDWHILQAVMHLTLNYRGAQVQNLGLSSREIDEISDRWVNEPEPENVILVPIEEFSVKNLQFQLRFSMMATVRSYGLELPRRTPDFDAISDFLGERYRYWVDDVEHPDYGF